MRRQKMSKVVYIVRHCAATGQEESAPLTNEGKSQAKKLVHFFNGIKIDQLISSPFVRALQTIDPLAKRRAMPIQVDDRLGERVLSAKNLSDWQEKLRATFINPQLSFTGGESSVQAAKRIKDVVDELDEDSRTIIVTHGNIMALLLREYDGQVGFKEWENLTNPDVYLLEINKNKQSLKRIWQSET